MCVFLPLLETFSPRFKIFDVFIYESMYNISTWKACAGCFAEEVGTGSGLKHSIFSFQNCSSGFWTRNRFYFINFLFADPTTDRTDLREEGKEPISRQKREFGDRKGHVEYK